MKTGNKENQDSLPSNDLVSHLEQNAKILPFPSEMLKKEKKRKRTILKKRVLAFCVDLYAILIIKIMMTLAYTSFFKSFFFQLPSFKQKAMLHGLQVIDLGTTPVLFFSYFIVSYFSGEGKTLGKLMFKLTVVRPDLKNDYFPTLKEAFMRTAAYLCCYFSVGTLFLLPFFRKDQKSLADLFSGTEVYSDMELYEALKENKTVDSQVTIDLVPTTEEEYKEKKVA